jgi:hypothetical protein
MHRAVAALLLAGLLALAGCGAVGAPGDRRSTATLTPAPVPDAEASPSSSPPPGALRAPLDPWTVADAHAATLSGNYTWVLTTNRTDYWVDFPNAGRETVRVVRVGNDTTYRLDRRVRGQRGDGAGMSAWRSASVEYAAGGTVFERRPPGSAVRSRPAARPRGAEGLIADRSEAIVARLLAAERTTVRRTRLDGAPVYVVRGNGTPPGVAATTDESVAEYRVRAVIRPDGRVTLLRARWQEGTRTVVDITARYRAEGVTTVERPAWVGNASAGTVDSAGIGAGTTDRSEDVGSRAAAADGSRANGTADWVGWPAWASDD